MATQDKPHPLLTWALVLALLAAARVLLTGSDAADAQARQPGLDAAHARLEARARELARSPAPATGADAAPGEEAAMLPGTKDALLELFAAPSGRACFLAALSIRDLLLQRQAGVSAASQAARIDALLAGPEVDLEAVAALRHATTLAYASAIDADPEQVARVMLGACEDIHGNLADNFAAPDDPGTDSGPAAI